MYFTTTCKRQPLLMVTQMFEDEEFKIVFPEEVKIVDHPTYTMSLLTTLLYKHYNKVKCYV